MRNLNYAALWGAILTAGGGLVASAQFTDFIPRPVAGILAAALAALQAGTAAYYVNVKNQNEQVNAAYQRLARDTAAPGGQ